MGDTNDFKAFMEAQCGELLKSCKTQEEMLEWIKKNSSKFREVYRKKIPDNNEKDE
jgi:hypothetical protein